MYILQTKHTYCQVVKCDGIYGGPPFHHWSHPSIGFQSSATNFCFLWVFKKKTRVPLIPCVCLIPAENPNRATPAIHRLISSVKTYSLFWLSGNRMADVLGAAFLLVVFTKRTLWRASADCWVDERRSSIAFCTCYITQTAAELKHSEGAIFIQLCLLHWGRLDVSAFKSFCELFHFDLRLFFFFIGVGCGINVNPCSELWCLWTVFFFLFFIPPPSPYETRTLCFQLPPVLPVLE